MPFQFRKEAIEEDLNSNFPSQGQGNPPLYYSLSEVVVPTYSINQAAEGSTLGENLQTAWDFSTGNAQQSGAGTTTLISNTGFWLVNLTATITYGAGGSTTAQMRINDGIGTKVVWKWEETFPNTDQHLTLESKNIVFLRSGDSLEINCTAGALLTAWYRQIAAVNGDLVNPLGYSAA